MNIKSIRDAEARSHIKMYNENELFAGSSWLKKPVDTVLELLPYFDEKDTVNVLDLGCGVGRNCIPAAQRFARKNCKIDCIDILPEAIFILSENAKRYNVESAIKGVVCPIDDYIIQPGRYDLIIAVSALEHMDSEDLFARKLAEIRDGLKPGGIVCIIINSSVTERDKSTGAPREPQFEINLGAEALSASFQDAFEDFEILKSAVSNQSYEIPRGDCVAVMKSKVVTFAAKKL